MISPNQNGSGLDGDNLQAVLDAAANGIGKGRAQFFTPAALARALALPLPAQRPCFVDLMMGEGSLMLGSGSKLDRVEAWIDDVIDEQKELRRQLEAQDAVIAAMQATRGDMDDADWWRKRERP